MKLTYEHSDDCGIKKNGNCSCGVALILLDEAQLMLRRGSILMAKTQLLYEIDVCNGKKISPKEMMKHNVFVVLIDDDYHVVFGEPNGEKGIIFPSKKLAEEYVTEYEALGVKGSMTPFHGEDCCGCTDIYFSRLLQEVVFVCNECGLLRKTGINHKDGGGVVGGSYPI